MPRNIFLWILQFCIGNNMEDPELSFICLWKYRLVPVLQGRTGHQLAPLEAGMPYGLLSLCFLSPFPEGDVTSQRSWHSRATTQPSSLQAAFVRQQGSEHRDTRTKHPQLHCSFYPILDNTNIQQLETESVMKYFPIWKSN